MRQLTQSDLKHILHYDPETGVWTWLNPASRNVKPGDIAGSEDGKGYRRIQIWGSAYRTGRLAFFYMKGYWPELIDHEDRHGGNDRWSNLREANSSQSNFNRYEGIRGVNQQGNKWRARVGPNNDLGLFNTFEEAVIARDALAKELGGEFAIMNAELIQ